MIAWPRLLFALLAFSTPALTSSSASSQQGVRNPRIALVIGNASYRDEALATTANDAGLVAQTLQAAGFDVVGARDLDGPSIRTAFRDFLDKASAAGPDMQSFVYLAGRGVQYNGDNYFVPVDAQIRRDADVPIDAVNISDFAHALAQTPGKARIIVLDAARASPYASQGSALAPGLALVDPEPGELIAFNAAPGTLAGDEQGPYGVYGKTLAGAMRQGGVSIVDVFDQTRVSVNQLTQGALVPWSASNLTEPYYIFERAPDAPPPPAAAAVDQPIASLPPDVAYSAALHRDTMDGYRDYLAAYPHSAQARRVRAILAARREAAFWRRSVDANTADAYWTYLRIYPRGPHVRDARRRLEMMSSAFEPPPDFRPMDYEDLPPPPPDEDFYEERPFYAFDAFGPPPPPPPPEYFYAQDDDWRILPPPAPPPAVGYLPLLPIAIPLVIGAVAFQHYNAYHRNGVAPANLPRFQPPPPTALMPLPANVVPPQPLAPIPVPSRQTAGEKRVKPLPPISPPAARGANGPGNAPAGGAAPAATPTGPTGGTKATQGAPALPGPTANPPSTSATPAAGGKPPGATPGAPPQLGKPLTVPTGTPPVAPPAPAGGKTPAPIPGAAPRLGGPPPAPAGTEPSAAGKLPAATPAAPVPPAPTKALPVPQAPAGAAAPNPGPLNPQAPGPRPLQNLAPKPGAAARRSHPRPPWPRPIPRPSQARSSASRPHRPRLRLSTRRLRPPPRSSMRPARPRRPSFTRRLHPRLRSSTRRRPLPRRPSFTRRLHPRLRSSTRRRPLPRRPSFTRRLRPLPRSSMRRRPPPGARRSRAASARCPGHPCAAARSPGARRSRAASTRGSGHPCGAARPAGARRSRAASSRCTWISLWRARPAGLSEIDPQARRRRTD